VPFSAAGAGGRAGIWRTPRSPYSGFQSAAATANVGGATTPPSGVRFAYSSSQ